MLKTDSSIIQPQTLSLLRELMLEPSLESFSLAGGTALALRLGHRNSVDLDLFSMHSFSVQKVEEQLARVFDFQTSGLEEDTLLGFIGKVKVDLIAHKYPLVQRIDFLDKIRFYSLPDIAAMKLNAIARSGQRIKDFLDIFFLLQQFSLNKMIDFYKVKYANSNEMIPLKALIYFEDLDWEMDRPELVSQVSDEALKSRLEEAVIHTDRIFQPLAD